MPRPRKRANPNRRLLLELLGNRERPATATDLYAELRETEHRLGLSTIYRNLRALAATGAVHEFHLDEECSYLACPAEAHEHLICRVCRRVQRRPLIPASQERLTDSPSFLVDENRIERFGLCRACRATRTGPAHSKV